MLNIHRPALPRDPRRAEIKHFLCAFALGIVIGALLLFTLTWLPEAITSTLDTLGAK